VRRVAFALAVLCAGAARAADNDLQLFRLGHPDAIIVGGVSEPGDPGAQFRFARLAATLALAFTPAFEDQAQTTGQAGFEVGFSGQVAYPRLAPEEWPTQGSLGASAAPQALFLPTLAVRKGLGGSVELGAAVSLLAASQMVAVSGQVRWAPIEGLYRAPDVALRAFATRVVGTQEMQLTFGGADLLVSKNFGVAGTIRLQPYAQYGITLVNAISSAVDFSPGAEDPADPTADDSSFHTISFWENRYHHVAIGVRMIAGSVLLGLEGGVAFGTNAVERNSSIQQFTRVWTSSARVGLSF
jgi:hypothetical protein